MNQFRSRVAAGLATVLAATFLSTVATPSAALAAGGPSVEPPDTQSTTVSRETMGGREQDQASRNALTGDQPSGGAPKVGAGTPRATSLSPSATWQVSPQTGDFTWSYPLRVPPAPGGLEPDLALSYASSTVDGRTSSTNNQASWAGDGWDLVPGFVERVYGPCTEDTMGGTTPPETGDVCWRSDNAVAVYDGSGGHLVCCDSGGLWRTKSDDGSRIERLTGATNGDDDGEYWKITKVDGTQYFFGSRPEAKSTWTVPVFGDDQGEPCHSAAGFAASHCEQAWRWNLDKVLDRNGNLIHYGYDAETNSYGLNKKDAAVPYVRGGTLRTIEYGMRAGQAPSGQIEFVVADRCVPGSTCTADRKDNWPDVPWDEKCDTANCKDHYSPTFWSTKRLSKIITRVRGAGGGLTDVDSWTLEHVFPKPGDGEKATLWLKSIVHTGHAGGEIALPAVTFEGTALNNRVFKVDGLAPLNRYRITAVVSESGGALSVHYANPDCVEGSAMPANPETNTRRCFPVRWAPKGMPERTDYFHKYAVRSVTQSDQFTALPQPITANIQQVTSYEYLDGAAWHRDTSEFTKEEKRTWDDFRGYGRVRIRTGVPDDPSGPIGLTEQRFYRGMHGDKLPNGGTRDVQVRPTQGAARNDEDWLQGFSLETITYDGDTDRVVSKTVEEPTWQGPTATRDPLKAYIVRPGATEAWTALAAGGWRTTRSESTYDDRGLLKSIDDLGDVATAADDRCTRTTYDRKTGPWLLDLPSRMEAVAVHCGATPSFPGDAVTDVLYEYEADGDLSRTRSLSARPATGDPQYYTTATNTYDDHGRVIESRDALDRLTKTAYTPATGGPVTQTVTTNALGHKVTTTLQPAWGLPTTVLDANRRKTESTYDALGRTTQVWLPNRPRTDWPDAGSAKFSYLVRGNAPTVVTSSTVNPNGNYITTKELYDGLLRPRQKQAPAVGGGRLLTDTRYDSQGRAYRTTQPYFNDAGVDDNIWVASDVEIPGHTAKIHDGAGRPVAEVYKAGSAERWRATTVYGGDRVHVTPPQGGTATTVIADARGRTVELRQYRAATPTGGYDATTYAYTKTGQLASTKDPLGNVWRFGYDIRGDKVRQEDPDRGTSTTAYDDAGQPVTVTDAAGVTLTTAYDDLGRKRTVKAGSTTLAEWKYDTSFKGLGQLASSTRYVDGAAYTRSIANYTELYHPYETTLTIPETPRTQTLAGSYTTFSTLNWDGSPNNATLPAAGDLAKETVSQEYDQLGNPTKLTGGPEGSPTFEYVAKTDYTRYGEVQRVEMGATPKRAWLSFYYETSTRRLARTIVDAEVTRPMQTDVNYEYDYAGNITSIANTPADLPHDVQCFRYDHLRRLTEAWTPTGGCGADPTTGALGGAAPYWHSYTYDAVGNRLAETQHAAAGDTVRTYGYPAAGAHKLASVTTARPATAPRTEQFTYDATGNTLTRPGQQLEWDQLGKLGQVSEGANKTRFVYDADGERVLREDPTTITLYLDGQDLALTKATGKLSTTRYYQHGETTVATRTAAGVNWEAGDHQDTAQVAIDAASQKVTQRRQTPFGVPRGTPVPWVGDKGFVGGTVDSSTGLTNLGARQYDPALGRFISVDPVMDLADPQQIHGYTYSNNSPITFADPSGLFLGGFFKKVWNGIKTGWKVVSTVAKHAAPILGYAALILGSATPVGLAIAGFVAVGINTINSCFVDRKALGCAAHAAELLPGVGKLAVGAAVTRRAAGGSGGAARFAKDHHIGGRPGDWLAGHTLGGHTKAIEAGAFGAGTYYYGTCGIKAVDCYGTGEATGGMEYEAPSPYVKWIQAENFVELPKPFYRHDFVGPMLAGGRKAKSASEWAYGPGGFAGVLKGTNKTKWAQPPSRSSSPPPQRSTPGPNNSYQTGDGRVCNRGGGMCAV